MKNAQSKSAMVISMRVILCRCQILHTDTHENLNSNPAESVFFTPRIYFETGVVKRIERQVVLRARHIRQIFDPLFLSTKFISGHPWAS